MVLRCSPAPFASMWKSIIALSEACDGYRCFHHCRTAGMQPPPLPSPALTRAQYLQANSRTRIISPFLLKAHLKNRWVGEIWKAQKKPPLSYIYLYFFARSVRKSLWQNLKLNRFQSVPSEWAWQGAGVEQRFLTSLQAPLEADLHPPPRSPLRASQTAAERQPGLLPGSHRASSPQTDLPWRLQESSRNLWEPLIWFVNWGKRLVFMKLNSPLSRNGALMWSLVSSWLKFNPLIGVSASASRGFRW